MKRLATVSFLVLTATLFLTAAANAQFVYDNLTINGRDAFVATDLTEGDVYDISATVGGTPLLVYDLPDGPFVTQLTVTDGQLYLFIIPPPSGGTVELTATPVGGGTAITGSKYYAPSASKISTTASLSVTPLSQVYGAIILTATVTATPTVNSGTVTFSDNGIPISQTPGVNSGVAILHAEGISVGVHSISAVYSGDSNYETSTAPAITLNIAQATLTVNGVTAENKIYDGGNSATLLTAGASLQGLVLTDVPFITFSTAGATGTFADKTASPGKTVTIAGIAIDGSSAPNYLLVQPTATATISTKVLTVNGVTGIDKVYDGNTVAALDTHGVVLVGVVSGDAVNLPPGLGVGNFDNKNVGTNKPVIVSGMKIEGGDKDNYTLTQPSTTASISKAAASVTPLAASKVYGTSDPVLTGTLSGFVASEGITPTYSRITGETVVGGPYAISATLSPAAALDNYAITYNTASFTISKTTASVSPAVASKTYGSTDPTLTGTLAGFISADGVTATYARTAGENVAGSPYAISATLGPVNVLDNYAITYNTAGFTINKAPASVSPNAASKVYGAADPALTGTLTGFVPVDGVTAAYTRVTGEAVAASPYSMSAVLSPAAALDNYTITYNTAPFTITKATVTPSFTASDKIYDGTTAATIATRTLTGIIGSDDVSLTGGVATFSDASVGNGKTVNGSGFSVSGSSAGNYQVSATSASTTANITKATASVTPAAASKTYGTADPALSGTITGFVSADGVSATYSRVAGEAAGQYTISGTLNPVDVLGNYTITYNTASFTVAKANASVTPNAVTKVYGTPDPALTGTVTGFVPVDNVTATYSRTSGESVAGSPYVISATLSPAAVLTNYTITYNTANFTITTNTSTTDLSSSAPTSVYGQPVIFTATVTGAGTPSGTVTFKDGASSLGTGTLNASGVATFTTSTLSVAGSPHSITAEYGGDANFAGSTSSPLSQTITPPPFTLTVNAANGSVTKSPDQANYVSGSTVTLTAVAASGYHFVNWTGDATGTTNPLSVLMDGNKTVTANFAINTFTLTTAASNGTIAKNPDQPTYASGANVQLTAIPATCYHFVGWSGDASGTSNPLTITMDANKNVTANFVGNTAPTVGSITAPLDPMAVNTAVSASVTFTDPDPGDPHTAIWTWGDGATSAGVISGQNDVTGSHTYTAAGVYTVEVKVADGCGAQAMTSFEFVVVYNPSGGFVVGGAWITSPVGAYVNNPTFVGKGYFAFVATYFGHSPVPVGATSFQLKTSLFKPAVMDFKSTSYEWLVVSGNLAQYKGTGKINGTGSYGFLLAVTDGNVSGGDRKDRFRIKIWNKNNGDALVYDNLPGADDDAAPVTVTDGGLIVVYATGSGGGYGSAEGPSIEQVIEEDASISIPTEYALHNAYPNPFNPSTTIKFDLPEATKVRLVVYDMLGREVAVLADGERPAGQHSLRFDAGKLSSGIYIYRLQTGNYTQTKKMMLMK